MRSLEIRCPRSRALRRGWLTGFKVSARLRRLHWTKKVDFGHLKPVKVPVSLSEGFGQPFQELIARFAVERGLIPDEPSLNSERFIARSIVPHVLKLSGTFNREEQEQGAGLSAYWKASSNPAHLRLAYFLYFMPSNLYRVASVWAELQRLGFQWHSDGLGRKGLLRAVEFGAGPAAGACGIAAGEHFAPVGLPTEGNWALIEQDKAVLELGAEWAEAYFRDRGFAKWETRSFHRPVELKKGFLPPAAPKFHLWVMSYFLNEYSEPAELIAERLLDGWERHLEMEGIAILVEPALKQQSRRLLEIRRELIARAGARGAGWLKILLPCLGVQACGALAEPEDWCHEQVSWWRPPYFRRIDDLAKLDRKTLPFSYLVVAKTHRPLEALLPALRLGSASDRYRLVSPAHAEGRDLEFFICGQSGKRRARFRADETNPGLERGDILKDTELRGDIHSTRVQRIGGLC